MSDSPGTQVDNVRLGRFAKLTFAATFLLVIAGSLVTTTGSGLAVPDWPLSFGRFFPPMRGGVLFEHGHRMIAGSVGLLMSVLAVWIWLAEPRRWVKWLALSAWCAVVLQAILGGITVLHKLPLSVSVAHTALAMIFFCLTAVVALVIDRSWQRARRSDVDFDSGPVMRTAAVTAAVIYLQIVVGAVMRHMGAGLAIPDFPLSYGRLIPPGLNIPTIAINFAHRVGALLVGAAIVYEYRVMRRHAPPEDPLRRWTQRLLGLYCAQFLLGAWTVWSIKNVFITSAHVAVGALTLVVSVMIAARTAQRRFAHESMAPRNVAPIGGPVEKPAGCPTEGVLPHVLVWQLIVIQSVTRGRVTPPPSRATRTRTLSTGP
ncbi:MAG: heme A synthase, partial [candidate division Zixibacteria bacterium]|nr:heme A synthase [candidate division Zixibacteria bacterium]